MNNCVTNRTWNEWDVFLRKDLKLPKYGSKERFEVIEMRFSGKYSTDWDVHRNVLNWVKCGSKKKKIELTEVWFEIVKTWSDWDVILRKNNLKWHFWEHLNVLKKSWTEWDVILGKDLKSLRYSSKRWASNERLEMTEILFYDLKELWCRSKNLGNTTQRVFDKWSKF